MVVHLKYTKVKKFVLKGLQWPLWLPDKWCIHRLANPRKGCASIVISMSV